MRNGERLAALSIMLLVMLVGAILVSQMFRRPSLNPAGCMPGTVACQ